MFLALINVAWYSAYYRVCARLEQICYTVEKRKKDAFWPIIDTLL